MNLEQKFTALEGLLQQHQTEVIAKLDAIAQALGAPPPTSTTTLADIATILGAIHTDTMSMDLKLLRIRDAIAPLDEALPQDEKSSVAWSLYRLMDAVAPTWPRPVGAPLQPQLAIIFRYLEKQFGLVPADSDESLLYYLSRLYGNVGIAGDATETVIGLLRSIQYGQQFQIGGVPPAETSVPPGSSIVSSGQVVAHEGRNFWRWTGELPMGIGFTNEITGLPPQVEIQPNEGRSWQGYQIYVQSGAAVFSLDPRNATQLPTNRWVDLSTNRYPIAVSVDAEHTLTVYLNVPAAPVSVIIQAEFIAIQGGAYWLIPWRGQLGAVGSTNDQGTNSSAQPVWLNPTRPYSMKPSAPITVYRVGQSIPVAAGASLLLEAGSHYYAVLGSGAFEIELSAG